MKTITMLAAGSLIGFGLLATFHAGIVFAADQRLADADAAIEKAIALLRAAENPGVEPPFGEHDKKAIRHAKKARKHIAEAIAYAGAMR